MVGISGFYTDSGLLLFPSTRFKGGPMVIGDRLKELREQNDMSQGDVEKKTGLLRCYISRVENGHTVPSVDTLEKLARALEVPMYKLFHDSEEKAVAPKLHTKQSSEWGASGKDAETLRQFRLYMAKVTETDQKLLVAMARKLAR
jgi:transcriptional regulator with XRE-family HTH domain